MILLEPKTIEVKGRKFIISKFPATIGREIVATYVSTGLPKVGDYKSNEAIMFKLMAHVAVIIEGNKEIRLQTQELIDNHIGDWETLLTVEKEVFEYNCSFFQNGKVSGFLNAFLQNLPLKISEILTALSRVSSPPIKPPSMN